MLKMCSALKSLLVAMILVVGISLTSGSAIAADKVHLKDGRVLEGTITREVEGYVWITVKLGGLESPQMFKPSEIAKIERDSKPEAAAAAATPAGETKKPEAAGKFGAPRVAIISLGDRAAHSDMVGIYMTAEELKRLIPLLEAEQVDTVVFRIDSGGGLGLEVQRLSDVIHNEYKPRFRVVGWIQWAISAAAMTSHCMEDIYFMSQGAYGACTGWYGDLQAVEGRQLEEMLFEMENISARGGHDPQIMRAMQVEEPLSCTIDANGDVHWYQNESGQYVVNPKGRILTFNSQDAVKYKFAKGVADTYEELAKAMGLTEVQWVGKRVAGVPYPVCRAEEEMRRFRNQVKDDEERTREYQVQYVTAYQIAASTPMEERGKFIAKCRAALESIKRMVKNNPNFALLVFNCLTEKQWRDWVSEREEEIRRLSRR
jgi:hypothetical protein